MLASALFLIIFLLIGGVSASNNTQSGQNVCSEINQDVISSDDFNLNEMDEILKASAGDTFDDIQTKISSAESGDTIELDGTYNGFGTAIIIL